MNQSNTSALQVGEGGSIRVIRTEGQRVTFRVSGVSIKVPEDKIVDAIKTVFGEGSQPRTERLKNKVPDYVFFRYFNEPIRNLTSLNIATQRMFMRIVDHFQTEEPGPIDACG